MSPERIVASFASKGIRLEAKLDYDGPRDLTENELNLLTENKPELIAYLNGREVIRKLPGDVEALVRAAEAGVAGFNLPGVTDVPKYILSYAVSYLLGSEDALLELKRLARLKQAAQLEPDDDGLGELWDDAEFSSADLEVA